jgi:hypothetical protein
MNNAASNTCARFARNGLPLEIVRPNWPPGCQSEILATRRL